MYDRFIYGRETPLNDPKEIIPIITDTKTGQIYSHFGSIIELLNEQEKKLNDKDDEIRLLEQKITILREEMKSTAYILKMQTRKLEGY